MVQSIAIASGKGGVGKTTVAAHLAGAFALMGYDVILLDNMSYGNIDNLEINGKTFGKFIQDDIRSKNVFD